MSQAEELSLDQLDEWNLPAGLAMEEPKHIKLKHVKNEKKVQEFILSCMMNTTNRHQLNKPKVGKMLTLISYDELFERSDGARIINKDIMTSSNVAEEINNAIFSNNDGDLGFTATCECGKLKGNYYEGAICPLCRTKVSTSFADKLSHTCWIAIPDDMPPVIHPIVYMVLKKWSTFKINEVPLIDLLINPETELPQELKKKFPKQGFTYFHEHFDEIMRELLDNYPKTANKSSTQLIRYFLNKYRHLIFCRKLPVLHNSLHVITKSGAVKCVDNSVKDALKTALNITYASFTHKRSVTHDKFVDTSLYNAYMGYVQYISSIGQHKLGDKYALFRHHLLGCRCHWSMRTVIVPHTIPVMADEVFLPWKIGVQSLKLELLNIMVNKYGISPTDTIYRHMRALSQYDELIDEIFNYLIDTHPYGGLPLIIGRNPSLQHGAMQLFKCTKIKTNVHDESFNIDPMVLKAPNGDFDGDALWGIFLKESEMVKDFWAMHPSKTMLSKNRPEVSSMITLIDQTRLMQNNWLMNDPYYANKK